MTAPPTLRSSSSACALSARRMSALTSTGVTTRSPATLKRTVFDSPGPAATNSYGPRRRVSGSSAPRAMNRFTLTIVSRGCSDANAAARRPPPDDDVAVGLVLDDARDERLLIAVADDDGPLVVDVRDEGVGRPEIDA